MKEINKKIKLSRLSKILKGLIVGLISLIVLISLNGCNTTTDNFDLWAQPICLSPKEKEVVSDINLDYFLLHNQMLGVKECNN